MSVRKPGEYARRVLVSVTGMSPAVVTETVYALAHQEDAFLPTELIVLTTSMGRLGFESDLIDKNNGRLWEFYKDYPQFAHARLPCDKVIVEALKDAEGKDLSDIISAEHNMLFADRATRLIRDLTADADCAIHVSLAGGRKTMGFFIGYALSIFGRFQDRLSHVLVPPEFEGNQAFYYPTPSSRIIRRKGGDGWLDTSTARVSLSEIPFVKLSKLVELPFHKDQNLRYMEVVERTNRLAAGFKVEVDFTDRSVRIGGEDLKLAESEFERYAWLAWRKKNECPYIQFDLRENANEAYAREFVAFGKAVFGDNFLFLDEGLQRRLKMNSDEKPLASSQKPGMDPEFFHSARSLIKSKIVDRFGEEAGERYGIQNQGKRAQYARYQIPVAEVDLILLNVPQSLGHLTPVD
jgi:CRISPR-associated protein (TIGR02584 family)